MFKWLAKYIRRIDILGVGVELREPWEPSAPTAAGASPPVLPRSPSPIAMSAASTSLTGDRAAFLREVEQIVGAETRKDYEVVLDDLIAWSETQDGAIEFRLRPAANSQATVTYCFQGTPHVFWQVYPRPTKRDAKFSSVSDPRWLVPEDVRDRLRLRFAELSGGRVDSPVIPTLSFRDLVTPAARERLKKLLSEVLAELRGRVRTGRAE
jgi:hypothetical protein